MPLIYLYVVIARVCVFGYRSNTNGPIEQVLAKLHRLK